MRQHYTEEQANQILRRAVERMPMKDEMSREQLESIAGELGVSPEALKKAEDDWEAEEQDKADRKAYIAMRRRGFRHGLAAFALLNLVLFVAALASGGEDGPVALFITVLLGSGIGLGIHGASALRTTGDDFDVSFARWRIERRARELATRELSRIPPRSDT